MGLRRWGRDARAAWAAMPNSARALMAGSLVSAELAIAAQVTGLVSAGPVQVWAVNLGWTLAGAAALAGCLGAVLRVQRSSVWWAMLLFAAGSGCWTAGGIIRLAVAGGSLSPAAASCWLAFAVCAIAQFAVRLPRPHIFAIFLLDAIPVVLLLVIIVRVVEPPPPGISTVNAMFLNLYPALFGLLAANAIQMAGIHWTLRQIPLTIWLITPGFCLMALAALIWTPAVIHSGYPQGQPSGALWPLGVLALAVAGVGRMVKPAGGPALPPVELARGPHALPAAAAVFGLIVMLAVIAARDRLLLLVFLLVAALDLFVRAYQLRRQDLRLLARLGSQNERLRELDRMKDEFVSLVSHELRTPLTSIRGYVEMLLEQDADPLSPGQRRFITVIERNAERLLRLVSDLLFLSRLQGGGLAMEFADIDLPELVRHGVEAARPLAAGKDVSLTLSVSPVPRLAADGMRLGQLVDNLLSNAVKFTPGGGAVTVTVGTEGQDAALNVADTGLGISAADREQGFERFFRVRNAASQDVPGTGLGLTITKAIVDAHGGTISVSSEPGHGTTFRVRLPLGGADNAPADPSTSGAPDAAPERRLAQMGAGGRAAGAGVLAVLGCSSPPPISGRGTDVLVRTIVDGGGLSAAVLIDRDPPPGDHPSKGNEHRRLRELAPCWPQGRLTSPGRRQSMASAQVRDYGQDDGRLYSCAPRRISMVNDSAVGGSDCALAVHSPFRRVRCP